jgi:predicted TIM-barrel fold metal-dependent hydrolase
MNTSDTSGKSRHIPIRNSWLALREEQPIDPDTPIVDAHHHLWDKPGGRYTCEEMEADIAGGHNVVATVLVETRDNFATSGDPALRSLVETEMAAAVSVDCEKRSPACPHIAAGIIGFIDLRLGDRAGEILDIHIDAAKGRFRGVRNASAWHQDPAARGSVLSPPEGLLVDPEFRRGFRQLVRRGLTFDAWMYHTQLDEAVSLARAFPDARIVLNHQGGPIGIGPYSGRRSDVFAVWRAGMKAVADCRNISVKLGGLGMLMAGFDFHERSLPPTSDDLVEGWGPYFETCIDFFGPERCMFESNFPVDKGTASYNVVWNTFKKVAKRFSLTEQSSLLCTTAKKTYGLQGAGTRNTATIRSYDNGANG